MIKKNLGFYVIIDYTRDAKGFATGGAMNKKIYHYYNKSLIKVEPYNRVKHKLLIRQNMYIKDKTAGFDRPRDSTEVDLLNQTLGSIELSRRIG